MPARTRSMSANKEWTADPEQNEPPFIAIPLKKRRSADEMLLEALDRRAKYGRTTTPPTPPARSTKRRANSDELTGGAAKRPSSLKRRADDELTDQTVKRSKTINRAMPVAPSAGNELTEVLRDNNTMLESPISLKRGVDDDKLTGAPRADNNTILESPSPLKCKVGDSDKLTRAPRADTSPLKRRADDELTDQTVKRPKTINRAMPVAPSTGNELAETLRDTKKILDSSPKRSVDVYTQAHEIVNHGTTIIVRQLELAYVAHGGTFEEFDFDYSMGLMEDVIQTIKEGYFIEHPPCVRDFAYQKLHPLHRYRPLSL